MLEPPVDEDGADELDAVELELLSEEVDEDLAGSEEVDPLRLSVR